MMAALYASAPPPPPPPPRARAEYYVCSNCGALQTTAHTWTGDVLSFLSDALCQACAELAIWALALRGNGGRGDVPPACALTHLLELSHPAAAAAVASDDVRSFLRRWPS